MPCLRGKQEQWKKKEGLGLGVSGREKAQGGQTTRQKQRPRQSQQLPDHMIADRCQGRRRKVACRSGRAQDKVRMSKEKERKRGQREDTAQRENTKNIQRTADRRKKGKKEKKKKKKKPQRKKRAESTVSEGAAD